MCALVVPARADDITAKDLQVIGRTLGFMEDVPAGALELGIVYSPADAESVRQADAVRMALAGGLRAGKLVLKPRLVAAGDLSGLDKVGALFIVPAASHVYAAVAATARRLHVPTISTDIACAEQGLCVLAFHTEPTVEITFSRTAAAEVGVRFIAAFRMLVRQI